VGAGLLAHIVHLGVGTGELQYPLAHEMIVHQGIGGAYETGAAHGEQLRVARSAAHQIYLSRPFP
jgi:hypothetical protein